MIESKKDFKEYVRCDALASRRDRVKPRLLGDEVWKFQYLMRKREYEIKEEQQRTIDDFDNIACDGLLICENYIRKYSKNKKLFII